MTRGTAANRNPVLGAHAWAYMRHGPDGCRDWEVHAARRASRTVTFRSGVLRQPVISGGDFVILEPGCVLIGFCGERSEREGAEQVADWVRQEGWEAQVAPISR